jgi:hypothetical protein
MSKLFSGRFIFTVITAIIFAQMAMTGKVSSEQAMATITLVIAFYFNKNTNGVQK